jgi:hypothetical protein
MFKKKNQFKFQLVPQFKFQLVPELDSTNENSFIWQVQMISWILGKKTCSAFKKTEKINFCVNNLIWYFRVEQVQSKLRSVGTQRDKLGGLFLHFIRVNSLHNPNKELKKLLLKQSCV